MSGTTFYVDLKAGDAPGTLEWQIEARVAMFFTILTNALLTTPGYRKKSG
jgi:hypothetical protein